eukprot:gene1521-2928_t
MQGIRSAWSSLTNLKVVEGSPEEKIIQYAKVLRDSSSTSSQCVSALNNINDLVSSPGVSLNHAAIDELGSSLEFLRTTSPVKYEKVAKLANKVRRRLYERIIPIQNPTVPDDISFAASEVWAPRVVETSSQGTFRLGSSIEYGFTSSSAKLNGFTFEGCIPKGQQHVIYTMEHTVLNIGQGVTAASLCELRVWNNARNNDQIRQTMCISIPPSSSDQFPDLRLSWLPQSCNGHLSDTGGIFYDMWYKQLVGTRLNTNTINTKHSTASITPIADTRWICALPSDLTTSLFATTAPWMSSYEIEYSESREIYEIQRCYTLPNIRINIPKSKLEIQSRDIVTNLTKNGSLWIPRTVYCSSNISIILPTTDDLNINNSNSFTIETWVNLRKQQNIPNNTNNIVWNTILSWGSNIKNNLKPEFLLGFYNNYPILEYGEVQLKGQYPIETSTWIHVATVFGNHTLRLVINGVTINITSYRHINTPNIPSKTSLLQLGSYNNKYPLLGDICEFRIWSIDRTDVQIQQHMSQSIPVLAVSSFPGLRLCWLPLRQGGCRSQDAWVRNMTLFVQNGRNTPLNNEKACITTSSTSTSSRHIEMDANSHTNTSVHTKPHHPLLPEALRVPCSTLLWDVLKARDCGIVSPVSLSSPSPMPVGVEMPTLVITTRSRCPGVPPPLLPHVSHHPPGWDSDTLAVLDEWTDEYDRVFVPPSLWPLDGEQLQLHPDSHSSPYDSTSSSSSIGKAWIPRVLKFNKNKTTSISTSILLGATADLGLLDAGKGTVAFTLETWISYIPKNTPTITSSTSPPASASSRILSPQKPLNDIQNILGHEGPEFSKAKSMFSFKRPDALLIGLIDGRPYVSCQGIPKTLKDTVVLSPIPLLVEVWTHVAIICKHTGIWSILINGKVIIESDHSNGFDVSGLSQIHMFGWEHENNFNSIICEMRLWSCERSVQDIMTTINIALPPHIIRNNSLNGNCLNSITTNSYSTSNIAYDFITDFYPNLRLTWLPLNSFIEPLEALPISSVVDDDNDSYESHFLPEDILNIPSIIPSVIPSATSSINPSVVSPSVAGNISKDGSNEW